MTVGDYIAKAALRFPGNVVVVDREKRLTAGELLERCNRLANALLGLGLKKGDRVAILLQNCRQAIEAFYGIARAGLVYVPLNTRNTGPELLYILKDSGAKAVLLGEEFGALIASILPQAPGVVHAISLKGIPPAGMRSYEDLLASASPGDPEVFVAEEDRYSIRYTAGTTGRPKGVLHTHRNTVVMLYNVLMDGFPVEEGDAILLTAPVTHASGTQVLPHIVRGAKVVVLPGFEVKTFLETIQKERITTLYLVPTMIVMILAYPDLAQYDLSSLKNIRYGASPISPETLKRAIRVFGNVFVQGYGLTEGLNPLTILSKEDHVLDGTEKRLKRLGSIGREVTIATVRIMDEEGAFLPPGQVGEIVARSEQNMACYWNNPEATAQTLRDGWLHTRDLGYMDEDGYVYLVDRKDDMIVSGGFNVYPKEVENVLYQHPAVLEAAVFGVPDEKWGEAVRAAVSLKSGMKATEEEILEHCRKHLAGYKKPKSVGFMDALPKSSYGKILRRALKAPFWKDRERMIN